MGNQEIIIIILTPFAIVGASHMLAQFILWRRERAVLRRRRRL